MKGGFLGGPDADWWIQKNCPNRLCIDGGGCAKADAPRKDGKWAVVCDKKNGSVGLTEYPNVVSQWIWGEKFFGEVDARMWANQKCPTWHCDRDGKCLPGSQPIEGTGGRSLELPPDFSNIGGRYTAAGERRDREVGDRSAADASTYGTGVTTLPPGPITPSGGTTTTSTGGTTTFKCKTNDDCWTYYQKKDDKNYLGYYCKKASGECIKCLPGLHGKKDGTEDCCDD